MKHYFFFFSTLPAIQQLASGTVAAGDDIVFMMDRSTKEEVSLLERAIMLLVSKDLN
jgi:hypothetical protein